MNDQASQTQPPQPTMHQQVAAFIHNTLQTAATVPVAQMENMTQALKWLELVANGKFIVLDPANPTQGLAPAETPAETPDPAEEPEADTNADQAA